MRAALGLLLALLATPVAAAAVSVDDVVVPERTMAGKPFEVALRLVNDGPAQDVTLFGALYDRVEGQGPCGSATDPRFRGFTHLVQERVRVPANGALDFPPEGARWLHRYDREDVPDAPGLAEFCVFVADAGAPSPAIEYEAYGVVPLNVRGTNAVPTASFTWEPETPGATQDAVFRAEGADADGDPLGFRWDFGHLNASGRAVADGARVTHFFYPAGEYTVTLVATDGLNETIVARTVRVAEAPAAEPARGLPVPLGPIALVAVVVALALRRP